MSEKHVKELRRARRAIAARQETFVCNALEREGKVYDKLAAQQIVDQIALDLGPLGTLARWVSVTTKERVIYGDSETEKKMRLTRLAWIDAMIEYWKDKP